MESQQRDVPKSELNKPELVNPQPVIYSSTTIVLGVLGYLLVLILAKLANDNRNLLFKEASFGQSHDHIIEIDAVERTPRDLNWEFIGTSGTSKVDSYVRKVQGSKLFAFKGVVVIDEHISGVMKTFGSVSTTPEWADMLKIMETLPVALTTEDCLTGSEKQRKGLFGNMFNKIKSITKKNVAETPLVRADGDNILLNRPYTPKSTATLSDIVYQYYILPWPIAPREFLFRRDFTIYPTTHSITSRYISTTDDRQPLPLSHRSAASTSTVNTTPSGTDVSKHTIRAESPFTNWLFQDLDTYCLQALHTSNSASPTSTTKSHPSARATQVCEEVVRALIADAAAPGKHSQERKRRTYIEIESLVDNKGSLPAWLVNYVQRSWAPKTLSAMAASVYRQAATTREIDDNNDSGGVVKYIAEW